MSSDKVVDWWLWCGEGDLNPVGFLMAVPNQNINALTLRSLFENEKLNESNFLDWYKSLRITLKYEGKLHHTDSPSLILLMRMPLLSKSLLIKHYFLSKIRFRSNQLNACKMEEGQSVSSHVLKMKSYIDKLKRLGHPMPHVWDNKSLGELHAMLKTTKNNVPTKIVVPSLHMIMDKGGMRSSKRLEKSVMVVHMRNGNQAEVGAIGSYFLNGYDLETAACILNMVPTKKVEKTPYEMWHGKVLKLSFLKVWGCDVLVKRSTPKKLETRAIKYSEGHDLGDHKEPETYRQAMTGIKSSKWLEAMNAEM
ncbi:hypothetical protein Tco_0621973 [Tanacetum coccineum]